jgi:acid phosphatase (class A)
MSFSSDVSISEVARPVLALVFVAIAAGCASFNRADEHETVPEIRPGILAGYLPIEVLPDSLALLPPPPTPGSAAFALDKEVSQDTSALRGSLRWRLAAEDANLMFPPAAGIFSCALDAPITADRTPQLYLLLRRSLADAGLSTYAAKNHYMRKRPFVVNRQPTCTPDEEEHLSQDGSYPSGHTAIGWAWALILTEIAPDRSNQLLARGRAFGRSRVICNVHWNSDVIEGRSVGAAAVARLHADAGFRKALAAAKSEVEAVRGMGLKPTRDCNSETEALGRE